MVRDDTAYRNFCRKNGRAQGARPFAGVLWHLRIIRSDWHAGCARVQQFLSASISAPPTPARNKCLHVAGYLAWTLGETERAQSFYAECLRASDALHDERNAGYAERGLALMAYADGEHERAQYFFQNALARFRALDDGLGIGYALNGLGELARVQKDFEMAEHIFQENLALARRLDFPASIAVQLHNLGHVFLAQGDVAQALTYLRKALRLDQALGDQRKMAEDVAGLACCFAAQGDFERAAKWFAAVEQTLVKLDVRLDPTDRRDVDEFLQRAQKQLTRQQFDAAWAEGQTLKLEDAFLGEVR